MMTSVLVFVFNIQELKKTYLQGSEKTVQVTRIPNFRINCLKQFDVFASNTVYFNPDLNSIMSNSQRQCLFFFLRIRTLQIKMIFGF